LMKEDGMTGSLGRAGLPAHIGERHSSSRSSDERSDDKRDRGATVGKKLPGDTGIARVVICTSGKPTIAGRGKSYGRKINGPESRRTPQYQTGRVRHQSLSGGSQSLVAFPFYDV